METKIRALQGLRAYAFLLIFISHCSIPIVSNNLGTMGVSLFLVLSGYLSMMQLDRNHSYTIFQVLKRKIRKFIPLHWFTLLCTIPLNIYLFQSLDIGNLWTLILNATCFHAWIPVQRVFFFIQLCIMVFMFNSFYGSDKFYCK